jgi:hypothetical protein
MTNLDETVQPESLKLRSPWSLFFSSQTKTSSWETKKVYDFDNVGDFMSLSNHTKLPSNFTGTIELSMFISGVTPDWELEPCKSGGRWNVRIEKLADSQIDHSWSELLLALVGGSMIADLPEHLQGSVLGVAYSGKPQAARKFSLWLSCRDADSCNLIGNKFKDTLQAILPQRELGEFAFNDFTTNDKYAFVLGTKKEKRPSGTAGLKRNSPTKI